MNKIEFAFSALGLLWGWGERISLATTKQRLTPKLPCAPKVFTQESECFILTVKNIIQNTLIPKSLFS